MSIGQVVLLKSNLREGGELRRKVAATGAQFFIRPKPPSPFPQLPSAANTVPTHIQIMIIWGFFSDT
jgi:hypothetical protein